MKLYKIFNHLDIERSKYPKWATFILNSYDEGTHYDIVTEDNKKYYEIVPALAIIILDKYNIDVSIIKDIMLQDEDLTKLVSNIKLDEDYHYMITHVKRMIYTNSGIPKGYSMPSEVGLNQSKLQNLNLVDSAYNITEEGHEYLKIRPIVQASGIRWHVVIKVFYAAYLIEKYNSLINLNIDGKPINAFKPWDASTYRDLIYLNTLGHTIEEIAEKMGRSNNSIDCKLKELIKPPSMEKPTNIIEPVKPIEPETYNDLDELETYDL